VGRLEDIRRGKARRREKDAAAEVFGILQLILERGGSVRNRKIGHHGRIIHIMKRGLYLYVTGRVYTNLRICQSQEEPVWARVGNE